MVQNVWPTKKHGYPKTTTPPSLRDPESAPLSPKKEPRPKILGSKVLGRMFGRRTKPRYLADVGPPEPRYSDRVGFEDILAPLPPAHAPVVAQAVPQAGPVVPAGPAPLPLAPGTGLPTRQILGYRPEQGTIYDVGNQPMLHTRFLTRAGARSKVAIGGGYLLIRPSHVVVTVERVTRATRRDLSTYLTGRFPLGGNISGKTYSNTSLLRVVLSMLPGTVTISA